MTRPFLHLLASAHAPCPYPIPSIHATILPSSVRRVGRDHVLLSDRWVACAPAPISPPISPRRSLGDNNLNDKAKQAVKDAAGNGVKIEL